MHKLLSVALVAILNSPTSAPPLSRHVDYYPLCSPRSIDTKAGLIYAGFGNELRILDPAAPTQPTEIGSLPLSGVIEDVAIDGTRAYVALGSAGIAIVDITTATQPTLYATTDVTGSALRIDVEMPYAYVAAERGGLRIVDISNPALPLEIGSYVPTESGPYATGPYARIRGVDASGSTAYIIGETYFWAIDITDPTSPTLLAHVSTEGFASDVKAGDNRAYIVTQGLRVRNGGFGVVPLSNSPTPTITWFNPSIGYGQRLLIADNHAFVLSESLSVFTITNELSATLASQTLLPGGSFGVDLAITGTTAFAAIQSSSFISMDVSNPVSPTLGNPFIPTCRIAPKAWLPAVSQTQ